MWYLGFSILYIRTHAYIILKITTCVSISGGLKATNGNETKIFKFTILYDM